jgi:DNA primase
LKIDHEKLQELCEKIDLLEYAEKSIDFQKRGSDEYAAHCPLHEDKTPSLMITPSRNLFYCHSCHVGGNIVNWLMTFEHMRWNDAVDKASHLAGVDITNLKSCEALAFFKTIKKSQQPKIGFVEDRQVLPYSYYEQFSKDIPEEWEREGIPAEIMRKFDIRIDYSSNRIVYPVWDNDFNLIGCKGRTRFENYKELGLKKYLNYSKIQGTDYFAGMKENKQNIIESGFVIIFEGIKSVMHVAAWGINNALAAETSHINNAQSAILVSLGVKEIIIAFDKGVSFQEIKKNTQLLRRFTNVSVMIDKWNLLDDKDSPCDKGEQIFKTLYERRVKL